MPLVIKDLVIDCEDPQRVAAFWSALLDRPVTATIGPYVFLTRGDGPGLAFQKVDRPTTGKNRIHVDLASPDPAAEQRRVEALGGRRLEEYAGGGFLVMADPEGNEFCIIPEGPFDVDDDGRADYLAAPVS
ncbi:VOC family protein [Streptomyces sp. NPDC089799]|uniref:VOC family protein n=1 Tax=Streptomyces sp. NPDC089799 TaxID=3155066 RepID=UPI00341909FF